MKQFYKLFLVLFVALFAIHSSHAFSSRNPQPYANNVTKIGDLYYVLDTSNKTATVTYESMNPNNYNTLTEVLIPATIEDNGITYDVTTIGEGAFSDAENIMSLSMSDAITHIEYQAFAWCSSLVNVCLSNSITVLPEEAFRLCTSLETIEIPSSVVTIESECFDECRSLKKVIIPNSVTYIDNSAFRDCNSLEDIVLPESLETLGVWVFENTNLKSLTCKAVTPPVFYYEYNSNLNDYFDEEIYLNCKLYVPEESLNLYQTTFPWSEFADILKIDSAAIAVIQTEAKGDYHVYDITGKNIKVIKNESAIKDLSKGLYIINGKKVIVE